MTATCRACGEPLHPSLVDNDGGGVHAGCVAAPHPVLPVAADVLARHQGGMARSRQTTLGPSQAGNPCDRALAYALWDTPKVSDEPLKWLPLLGTWAHAGMAQAYAAENVRLGREQYLIERRVELPSELVPGGTADLYDTDCGEVVDWKLVGQTPLRRYRKDGPTATYRVQAHLYGLGFVHAGFPVTSVRIVFLPRSGRQLGDGWEWSEPYNERLALKALSRVSRIKATGDALDLAHDGSGYALLATDPEAECEWCPWRREWTADGASEPANQTGCPGLPQQGN